MVLARAIGNTQNIFRIAIVCIVVLQLSAMTEQFLFSNGCVEYRCTIEKLKLFLGTKLLGLGSKCDSQNHLRDWKILLQWPLTVDSISYPDRLMISRWVQPLNTSDTSDTKVWEILTRYQDRKGGKNSDKISI